MTRLSLYFLLLLFLLNRPAWSLDLTVDGRVHFKGGVLSFQVHGSADQQETMNAVKEILEKDPSTKKLLNYFRYQPKQDVHFYVNGKARLFNGYALPSPHRFISLFNIPPTHQHSLAQSDQWFKILVLHELAHIIHLDQARGAFGFLRSIFGSIIFPGWIIPRWVAEGVATWAESEFTSSGRLNSPLFKFDLYRKLKEEEFCREIGCLDDPGHHPYGGYAYLAGGFFFDYLERNHPGAIRCLAESNSRLFPFFMNWAFKDCLGKGADSLFLEFQESFVKEYEKKFESDSYHSLLPYEEHISWFLGTVLKKKTLFYIYWQEREQFIGAYNFETKHFRSWGLRRSIEGLRLNGRGEVVVAESYVGQDERGKRSSYKLLEDKFISTPLRSALYRFETQKGTVSLDYHASQWTVTNELGEKYEFPRGYWITHPQIFGEKIYFKLTREEGGAGQVMVMDFQDLKGQGLYRIQGKNTSFLGRCDGSVYFLDGGRLVELGKKKRRYWRVGSLLLARFSSEGVFALTKSGPKFYPGSCRDYISRHTEKKVQVLSKKPTTPLKSRKIYQKPDRTRPYLFSGNLFPQYWLLETLLTNNAELKVKTEFTDPRGIHSFKPTLRYYSQQGGTITPELTYTYSPRSFILGGGYKKSRVFAVDEEEKEREGRYGFFGYQFLGDEIWSYVPSLIFYEEREEDWRDGWRRTIRFSQEFYWNKQRTHQWMDHFYLRGVLGHSVNQSDYWFWRAKMNLGWNWGHSFRIRWVGGHSFIFNEEEKNTYSDVCAYLSGEGFHPLMGVNGSGVCGRKIISGRANFHYRLAAPYSGSGFFPFHTQERWVVGGLGAIRSDTMIIGDERYTKEGVARSYYGGFRDKIKLFYMLPLNAYFLAFRVSRDNSSEGGVSVFLSTEL